MKSAATDSVWETQEGKKSESRLCLGPGVFIEVAGLVHMASQASRKKEACLGVLHKSLLPWNQSLDESSHSLHVTYCAGRFQRNH